MLFHHVLSSSTGSKDYCTAVVLIAAFFFISFNIFHIHMSMNFVFIERFKQKDELGKTSPVSVRQLPINCDTMS